MLDYHNFVLKNWLKADQVDYQKTLDEALAFGDYVDPMIDDVSTTLHQVRKSGGNILYEGAQGALLDIDHGTYPYVTSSNTTVGGAYAGTGVGASDIDYVLGICKAYATRVGGGPFPTELTDDIGDALRKKGNEYGATTGRPRRCGWIDLVALKRAVQINGINGLAITKLDVLDGLPSIKVCIAYEYRGKRRELAPLDAAGWDECKPVYLEFPGWEESTCGVREFSKLPPAARAYLRAVEELAETPHRAGRHRRRSRRHHRADRSVPVSRHSRLEGQKGRRGPLFAALHMARNKLRRFGLESATAGVIGTAHAGRLRHDHSIARHWRSLSRDEDASPPGVLRRRELHVVAVAGILRRRRQRAAPVERAAGTHRRTRRPHRRRDPRSASGRCDGRARRRPAESPSDLAVELIDLLVTLSPEKPSTECLDFMRWRLCEWIVENRRGRGMQQQGNVA